MLSTDRKCIAAADIFLMVDRNYIRSTLSLAVAMYIVEKGYFCNLKGILTLKDKFPETEEDMALLSYKLYTSPYCGAHSGAYLRYNTR